MVGQTAYALDSVLPSSDSTFRARGEQAGWTILVDEGRNARLMERMDENEKVIQMGLTTDHAFGQFRVFTKNAEVKNKEDIVLSRGDNLYTAKARGKTKNLADGYVGGYFLANTPHFVEDVMKQHEMLIFPEETYAWIVSLDGTMKAIEAAMECNMEVGG